MLASGIGLAKASVVSGGRNASGIQMSVQQLTIPDYHKVMFRSDTQATYHIAGYGQSNEEALTRVMGETIERYSFMSSYHVLKDALVHASYAELRETALPLSLINVTKDDDAYFKHRDESTPLLWLQLYNYCTARAVYYPFCLIGNEPSTTQMVFPAMSTGTATHVSLEHALLNAMVEQLQIHAFMTAWYGMRALPVVNWEPFISKALRTVIEKTFTAHSFEIIVLDCSIAECDFKNYITILKNKNGQYPYCAIGVQGGFVAEEVLLRSMMEAAAIYVNLQQFSVFKESLIQSFTQDTILKQYNLDAPFLYWSNYNDYAQKETILNALCDYSHRTDFTIGPQYTITEQLKKIIDFYQSSLHFFSVLEITPPEVTAYGYRTVRVIAPELVPMNFPALTYDNHPAFLRQGGIRNGHFTHPLP
ncbi:MAG: YcaO-like family protein [Treponema sp.]|nr:YcaO-like family protein [Treponema sp.]